MNSTLRTLPALLIAVLATGSAFAQSTDKRALVLPHVLEASAKPVAAAQFEYDVKAPRDCASGQSSGKRIATYDLKTAKGARASAPSCDSTDMAISTQGAPATKGSVVVDPNEPPAKHTKTGHVTLMK